MSDLINRSALIEALQKDREQICSHIFAHVGYDDESALMMDLVQIISNQPTIEAVEVVHGEWTRTGYCGEWECSNCKSQMELSDDTNGHPNFCPNCGADMRKGGSHE